MIIKNLIRIFYLSCFAVIEQRSILYINAVFDSIKNIPRIFNEERTVYPVLFLNKIRTSDNFKGG